MNKSAESYYKSLGSRLGYKFVTHGSQHFGFHPIDGTKVTEHEAQLAHHDMLAQALDLKPTDNVLDAGCGQGFVACDLSSRYGSSITGVDITPYIIREARTRSRKEKVDSRTSFYEMDYSRLAFEDDSFDKVYTVESLCHAPDLPRALKELRRVLKPRGKIVCVEYTKKPRVEFNPHEARMYDIISAGTYSPSLDLFEDDNFLHLMGDAGFTRTQSIDISQHTKGTFDKFYNLAKVPYQPIRLLNLQPHFVNTTIGVEFYKMALRGLLGYRVYSAEK